MTAPYRSPGARPRKPYAAPRLTLLYRLWWDGPRGWFMALRWRLFGLRAENLPRGACDPATRVYPWSERATVLLRPHVIRTVLYLPRPWWRRAARLAWWTFTGRAW